MRLTALQIYGRFKSLYTGDRGAWSHPAMGLRLLQAGYDVPQKAPEWAWLIQNGLLSPLVERGAVLSNIWVKHPCPLWDEVYAIAWCDFQAEEPKLAEGLEP